MTKKKLSMAEQKILEDFKKYEATLRPIDPNDPPDPEAESIAMNIRNARK
ncbi:MAG: hypothetical protein JWO78_201 [Micavibrio sp.]|nr:hypothetical protein [Micavibrio sp.]